MASSKSSDLCYNCGMTGRRAINCLSKQCYSCKERWFKDPSGYHHNKDCQQNPANRSSKKRVAAVALYDKSESNDDEDDQEDM